MTTITISSGTSSVSTVVPNTTNYVVEGTGTLDVLNGGAVTGTILDAGGQLFVSGGGTASGTTINAAGYVYIYGTALGTVISGGYE